MILIFFNCILNSLITHQILKKLDLAYIDGIDRFKFMEYVKDNMLPIDIRNDFESIIENFIEKGIFYFEELPRHNGERIFYKDNHIKLLIYTESIERQFKYVLQNKLNEITNRVIDIFEYRQISLVSKYLIILLLNMRSYFITFDDYPYNFIFDNTHLNQVKRMKILTENVFLLIEYIVENQNLCNYIAYSE